MDVVALASLDPYTLQKNATVFAYDLALGATQYNRFKIASSNAQILEVANQDDRGFAAWELTIRLNNSSALNDAVTLTFD
jgi:hypothetical protein